jgi:DNA polymerase III sliding clamp (beta) subunit (PCNA family)
MFTLSESDLKKVYRSINMAGYKKTLLPVLKCAAVQVEDGLVQIISNKLDINVVLTLDAKGEYKNGKFLIPIDFLNCKVKGDVTYWPESDGITVCRQVAGVITKDTTPKIDEFPFPPNVEMELLVTLSSNELDRLYAVNKFTSEDASRPCLCGVSLEIGDTFRATATDGHRIGGFVSNSATMSAESVIVPKEAIAHLQKLRQAFPNCSDADFLKGTNENLYFLFGNDSVSVELCSIQIYGTFPDWRQILPPEDKYVPMDIGNLRLLVSNMVASGVETVEFFYNSEIGTLELLETSWVIDYHPLVPAQPFTARFNSKYILSCLELMSADAVEVFMTSGKTPMSLRTADTLAVVMPMARW